MDKENLTSGPSSEHEETGRDDMLFEVEQRLAQVGRKLSAEEASSLIAEDFVEFGSSGKASPFSLRSSIWRNNGETWQIVFHQGTNVK
jgi:hypothetical protein